MRTGQSIFRSTVRTFGPVVRTFASLKFPVAGCADTDLIAATGCQAVFAPACFIFAAAFGTDTDFSFAAADKVFGTAALKIFSAA